MIRPEECLVFEDSVSGIQAGFRAGMRVCWVPHPRLGRALAGRPEDCKREVKEVRRLVSADGRREMLSSLEDFDYERYGIRVMNDEEEIGGRVRQGRSSLNRRR